VSFTGVQGLSDARKIPELASLHRPPSRIRIPPGVDIPLTERVRRLIDAAPFQRLRRISQLGLVQLVYPGATHQRFEHALGVYRLLLLYLDQLLREPEWLEGVSAEQVELLLVAGLLHDIGHWPLCHPIEDMRLSELPRHEALARRLLVETELAELLRADWGLEPNQVADFLVGQRSDPPAIRLLQSLLSGPIDADKMDYLARDSLHAGVPYGNHFDAMRLIGSLCIDPQEQRLAITDKGRTAAEMMVFARYVMFSEVYWHPAVRSATAMLQRAVYGLTQAGVSPHTWPLLDDAQMFDQLRRQAAGGAAAPLIEGLMGTHRSLYKRIAELDCLHQPQLHASLARRPYSQLVAASRELAARFSALLGRPVAAEQVLIDAPPVKLEVQFRVRVRTRRGAWHPLAELSPVVATLAERQFDDLVKRLRIFVPAELVPLLRDAPLEALLAEVAEQLPDPA